MLRRFTRGTCTSKSEAAQGRHCLEGAAADGVGLVLLLLVARPQRQHVDEVQRDRHLLRRDRGADPVLFVRGPVTACTLGHWKQFQAADCHSSDHKLRHVMAVDCNCILRAFECSFHVLVEP